MWASVLLLALRSVRRNLLRSFLTILGIVIGVAAVITMVTVGNGATRAVSDQISSLGSNLLMVRPGQRMGPPSGGGGAPPFREAEFDIMYGEGISKEGDLIDLAVARNIVEKSGAWFSYSGERLGQGRENVKNGLKENTELRDRIEPEWLWAAEIHAPDGLLDKRMHDGR